MRKPTIIRRAKGKDNPYAQISREALQDGRLSWQATGLLAYFLSLPVDWEINIADISNRKKNGKHSSRTSLNELIHFGYAKKTSYRDEKGRYIRHEYVIYENPIYPLSNFQKVDTREYTYAGISSDDLDIRTQARKMQADQRQELLDEAQATGYGLKTSTNAPDLQKPTHKILTQRGQD